MLRFCSSIALFAMLAYACGSKHNGDDTAPAGTGGSLFNVGTGGSLGVGGSGYGGATSANGGLSDITKDQYDALAACVGWSSEGENLPALIDFVVDVSGSMLDTAANTSGRSKWAITQQALQDAVDALPTWTAVGMLLWPNRDTDPKHTYAGPFEDCINTGAMVPIAELGAAGSDQRNLISSALTNAYAAGGTPMADAYNYALSAVLDRKFVGAQYMVLITDGQPTIQLGCNGIGAEKYPVDFGPVLDSVANAWQQYVIETFVIGSPGSEAQSYTNIDGRDLLSATAKAGNTGPADCDNSGVPEYCHFDMSTVADFAAGFTSALQYITGQVLPCDFYVDPKDQTVDKNALNVIYKINGSTDWGQLKLVAPSPDDSCPQGNGWYLDPADPTHFILCPATCELIHKDVGAVVDFKGGCAPIVPIG